MNSTSQQLDKAEPRHTTFDYQNQKGKVLPSSNWPPIKLQIDLFEKKN